MFFLLFVLSKSDDDNPYLSGNNGGSVSSSIVPPNDNCTAPNTKKNSRGKCICTSQFPHGDPSLMTGCFRCKSKCNESAICVYPGRCQCNPGFSGNGVSECLANAPVLQRVFPDRVYIRSRFVLNVTYVYINGSGLNNGYIKIGSIISPCNNYSYGFVQCEIQSIDDVGAFPVQFSHNMITWSKEFVEIVVDPTDSNLGSFFIVLTIVSIIAFIGYFIKKKLKKAGINGELIPFLAKQ